MKWVALNRKPYMDRSVFETAKEELIRSIKPKVYVMPVTLPKQIDGIDAMHQARIYLGIQNTKSKVRK